MYLIYNKEEDAVKNLQQIYENMLEEYASNNNGEVYDKLQKKKVKIKDILKKYKTHSNLVILGKNAKTKIESLNEGFTVDWCSLLTLSNGKFALVKPKDSLMTDVYYDGISSEVIILI